MSTHKNNHYVPRFILKHFANKKGKIYNYNIEEMKLTKPHIAESFAKDKLYLEYNKSKPKQLEIDFNRKVESLFCNQILDPKIIGKDKIVLSRTELELMRKFVLLGMWRTKKQQIIKYSNDFNLYFRRELPKENIRDYFGFEEIVIEDETQEQRWLRELRVITECENIMTLKKSKDATYAICFIAELLQQSYFTFWDSSECEEDFIISDAGVASENLSDKSKMKLIEDFEKRIKLLRIPLTELQHVELFYAKHFTRLFNDNYFLFPITKNRIMVLIPAFFKVWMSKGLKLERMRSFPKTLLKDKNLYAKNYQEYDSEVARDTNNYIEFQLNISNDDIFIYDVKSLEHEDVLSVNSIILKDAYEEIGYCDPKKVLNSITQYNKKWSGGNYYKKLEDEISNTF
jgi:Protein of unknown function (DUF4238)